MKKYLKKILNNKSKLYFLLSYIYNFQDRYWRPKIVGSFDSVLLNYVSHKNSFSFIQIGSNDGKSNDPLYSLIHQYNGKGVFIEPVKYIFERLKENYTNLKNLSFENVAICNLDGEKEFYTIKESNNSDLPYWYNQLSSFRLETILAHKEIIPNIEDLIEKRIIECKKLSSIIEKYKLYELDILHIDAEGHDYEIIKTIDFKKYRPEIFIFENRHLCSNDYKSSLQVLKQFYKKIRRNKSGDTICYNGK